MASLLQALVAFFDQRGQRLAGLDGADCRQRGVKSLGG
jgi:hypothetical protein